MPHNPTGDDDMRNNLQPQLLNQLDEDGTPFTIMAPDKSERYAFITVMRHPTKPVSSIRVELTSDSPASGHWHAPVDRYADTLVYTITKPYLEQLLEALKIQCLRDGLTSTVIYEGDPA
jgi:hypothetical protein